MSRTVSITFGLTLLLGAVFPCSCIAGTIFDFQFSAPAPAGYTGYSSIFASGTLTAVFDPGSGDYVVSAIHGTRTVDGTVTNITGLIPPNGYFNSNVLLYPGPPLLDYNGLSFTTDNTALSDDGAGNVNIYYDPISGMYTELYPAASLGSFEVSLAPGVAPEPSTAILLIGGLLAAATCRRPA